MDERLVSQIEELGLSNKEARVYIANLMLGPAGVQQIADTSGIKRVTTYVILESLVSLGLVSQTTKTKKTLFNAESPDNLRRLLEKREQSLRDQRTQLEELLPDLGRLTSAPKDSPVVKFYDGVESMRTIYESVPEMMKKYNVKESYGISNLDSLYHYFPEINYQQSNPKRIEAGVTAKFIYTTSQGAVLKATDAEKRRESRYIPPGQFNFNTDISIIGNYISMLALDGAKPSGITIESANLAQALKATFDLAWEGAKQYQD